MQFLHGHNNVWPVGTKMNLWQIISQAEQMFTLHHTHMHTHTKNLGVKLRSAVLRYAHSIAKAK